MNEAVKFKLTLGNARQALPETQTQVRPGERLRAHQSIIKERTCERERKREKRLFLKNAYNTYRARGDH